MSPRACSALREEDIVVAQMKDLSFDLHRLTMHVKCRLSILRNQQVHMYVAKCVSSPRRRWNEMATFEKIPCRGSVQSLLGPESEPIELKEGVMNFPNRERPGGMELE